MRNYEPPQTIICWPPIVKTEGTGRSSSRDGSRQSSASFATDTTADETVSVLSRATYKKEESISSYQSPAQRSRSSRADTRQSSTHTNKFVGSKTCANNEKEELITFFRSASEGQAQRNSTRADTQQQSSVRSAPINKLVARNIRANNEKDKLLAFFQSGSSAQRSRRADTRNRMDSARRGVADAPVVEGVSSFVPRRDDYRGRDSSLIPRREHRKDGDYSLVSRRDSRRERDSQESHLHHQNHHYEDPRENKSHTYEWEYL